MTLKIYNSLTKKVSIFKPLHKQTVQMFVCGPTVYDYVHAGNARTFVIFDVVAKYLCYRQFDVTYIQNITDIDDKIIVRAQEHNTEPIAWARQYEEYFHEDMQNLGVTAVSRYARATEHIEQVVTQVQRLVEKGFAYRLDDGYYFDLAKFPAYGKLSGRTAQMAEDAVTRIDESDKKRNAGDFALWKFSKPGEPAWDSSLGKGRPGWHIEDTAITEYYFGSQYDLHGGGRDLMFPHHEAEIAQQEAASGKVPFVKYWMHSGFLETKSAKMSKSVGNIVSARELLHRYSPQVLRLYFLNAHYRSPLDFSDEILAQAQAGAARITEFLERLKFYETDTPFAHEEDSAVTAAIDALHQKALDTMDDDFNTPQAIGVLFELIHLVNQYIDQKKIDIHSVKRILRSLDLFDAVLGIVPHHHEIIPEKVRGLVAERQEAKEKNDFARADFIRTQIQSLGYTIDDTLQGPMIKKML